MENISQIKYLGRMEKYTPRCSMFTYFNRCFINICTHRCMILHCCKSKNCFVKHYYNTVVLWKIINALEP